MYIVLLAYTAPVEEIDYLLPDHMEWLAKQFEAGHFLASGRRPTRDGHVILTRAMPRERLEVLLAVDPLEKHHLVRHEVIEFRATRTAPELFLINEALAA